MSRVSPDKNSKINQLLWGGIVLLLIPAFAAIYLFFNYESLNSTNSVIALTVVIFLFISFATGKTLIDAALDKKKYLRGDTVAKIRKIANNLEESVGMINDLQDEINRGYQALDMLKRETRTHSELSRLTKKESEAVQAVLREELSKDNKRELLRDFIMALFGALVGVFLAKIFT